MPIAVRPCELTIRHHEPVHEVWLFANQFISLFNQRKPFHHTTVFVVVHCVVRICIQAHCNNVLLSQNSMTNKISFSPTHCSSIPQKQDFSVLPSRSRTWTIHVISFRLPVGLFHVSLSPRRANGDREIDVCGVPCMCMTFWDFPR